MSECGCVLMDVVRRKLDPSLRFGSGKPAPVQVGKCESTVLALYQYQYQYIYCMYAATGI